MAGVLADLRAARARSDGFARPLLVVVPSAELRQHLAAVLARGGATLGVAVVTLHGLAMEVHQRAGQPSAGSGALFEVLARRAAAAQPQIAKQVEGLDDGYGLAAAGIRDLLSAGMNPDDCGDTPMEAAAATTRKWMDERGCQRSGDMLVRAADLLEQGLNASKVWIHGFADATGQASVLLSALLQAGAEMVLDLPPDPASQAGALDRGATFARRFVQRLGVNEITAAAQDSAAGSIPSQPADQPLEAACKPSSEVHYFHAAGAQDEAREVAYRIRALLEGGADPDRILVVARSMQDYAIPLREWCENLGVPFCGGRSPAALSPVHRRLQAVIELLEDGADAAVDRWLDARPHHAWLEDFRVAMRSLGVTRVREVAALHAEIILAGRESLPLPVRYGLTETAASQQGGAEGGANGGLLPFEKDFRNRRRSLGGTLLIREIGAADSLCRALDEWPQIGSLAQHAECLRRLLDQDAGWPANERAPEEENWPLMVEALISLDPASEDYQRSEFLLLLRSFSSNFGAGPLGGRSGVRLLDLPHARGITADHLFLLGLNRGNLPRRMPDDCLLPDRLRRPLQQRLPHLALTEQRQDEEHYLFAQLLSAAPQVTLSWQRINAEGKEASPSPFLLRMWLEFGDEGSIEAVPRLRDELYAWSPSSEDSTPRPLCGSEALTWTALRRDRESWRALLQVVLQEAHDLEESAAAELADARLRVLEEYEPDRRQPSGRAIALQPGPYLGWLGSDPAAASRFYVTRLEGVARCPWQAFLSRGLGLERGLDPLAELPAVDHLLLGNTVHAALEALVRAALQRGRRSRPLDSVVAEAVAEATVRMARENDLHLSGLVDSLQLRALPLVQRAVEFEWADGGPLAATACEADGQVTVHMADGGRRTLHFRADRVDDGDDGPVLTDYKTGKPLSSAVWQRTRDRDLLKKVMQGSALQAAAYAASAEGASGRYLYLKQPDDRGLEFAEFRVPPEAEEILRQFHLTAGVLLEAVEAGVAVPRLEQLDGTEGKACAHCDFSEACLRHDSGARQRLREVMTADLEPAHSLWHLEQRKP